ncbi:MAG: diadenylate cyclase CdaA [Clostridia bacterium]|nr:diadenylate cyclase CdaA [Clostridia bacterium]
METFMQPINDLYKVNIWNYFLEIISNPFRLILGIIDLVIVLFLVYYSFKILKNTRAWQLIKGIVILIIITVLSKVLKLNILNYILSVVMTYGAFVCIVIFQPELRRALEQLGANKITNYFGINKDIEARKKENVYRIAIAAIELSKTKTGALIVIQRDVKIQDIIATGIPIDAEISPQLLCNIFVPNTPLHDGAVIISEGRIAAASCMLPLADDHDIARELGTRHRAAIGISKESDAIAVVVSEETGKISITKDGTLIADVREDVLKKILIKYLVTEEKTFPKESQEQK